MKNKKLTYILIPAVLLVWIIVGYKIYIKYAGDDVLLEYSEADPQINKSKLVSQEFHLMANYRDPFLGNNVREIEVKQIDPVTMQRPDKIIQPPVQIQKQPVRWPSINVGGKVNDKALIVIGNRKLIMAEGQESMGVKLLKLAKDSVKLRYQEEDKSFFLGK